MSARSVEMRARRVETRVGSLPAVLLAAPLLLGPLSAAPAPAEVPAPAAVAASDAAGQDRTGQPAPALVLQTASGRTIDLADLKGKLVVVDFWATWCGPCVEEMPEYNRIYRAYHKKGKGFELIGVALASGDRQDLQEWLEGQDVAYPVGIGSDSVSRAWGGVTVVPTTFVIDPDGKILKRIEGATAEKLAYIEETVKQYTASSPADPRR